MIEVKGSGQLKLLAPLFKGIEDSMVIACLQGYMGNAYIAVPENPAAGLIVSGEYCFFGGDPDSADAERLIKDLFTVIPGENTVAIFSDDKPDWERKLLSYPENNPVSVPRYGIAQRDYEFDENVLQKYINAVPEGFILAPFDNDIYEQAMRYDWSREFCETFHSADDYLKRGFGFAFLDNGALVSGASTMTVYDGGVEIQVATHEKYRRRGLAMPCAASLVKECARRKIRPHWDAANLVSKNMALSLGFEYRGEYITVHMHK